MAKRIGFGEGGSLVLEQESSTPMVAVVALFLGGSRCETKATSGISNLLAICLSRDKGLRRSVDSGGGQIDVISTPDSFGLAIIALASSCSLICETLVETFARGVSNLDQFEEGRQFVQAQVTDAPSDAQRGFREFRKLWAGEHPYRFLPSGDRQSLERLTWEEVVDWHERFVVQSNAAWTVVGDVAVDALASRLGAGLASLPAGQRAGGPVAHASTRMGQERVCHRIGKEAQATLLLGFDAPSLQAAESSVFMVLEQMCTSSGSTIFQNLRSQRALTYDVGCVYEGLLDRGYFVFSTAIAPEHADEAERLLARGLHSIVAQAGPADVEISKELLMTRHQLYLQSNVEYRARCYAWDELYGLGYEQTHRLPDRIDEVSVEQIRMAYRQYLNPDESIVVQILPEYLRETVQ